MSDLLVQMITKLKILRWCDMGITIYCSYQTTVELYRFMFVCYWYIDKRNWKWILPLMQRSDLPVQLITQLKIYRCCDMGVVILQVPNYCWVIQVHVHVLFFLVTIVGQHHVGVIMFFGSIAKFPKRGPKKKNERETQLPIIRRGLVFV